MRTAVPPLSTHMQLPLLPDAMLKNRKALTSPFIENGAGAAPTPLFYSIPFYPATFSVSV
jgi:hypothetical protein